MIGGVSGLSFVLFLCLRRTHQSTIQEQENPHEWDILIFTQTWPESFCRVASHEDPDNSCAYPDRKDWWTVHGIWPSRLDGTFPFDCNNTWLFDPEQIKPIEYELDQMWTNMLKNTNHYYLWKHEWEKHGTCSASIEDLNTELKYFKQGINLNQRYQMSRILRTAGINPSNIRILTAEELINAVKTTTGMDAMIACKIQDGVQYLYDIRICFDKQFDVIDCGIMEEHCDASKGIIYPARTK